MMEGGGSLLELAEISRSESGGPVPDIPGSFCMFAESKPYVDSMVIVWKITDFFRAFKFKKYDLWSMEFEAKNEAKWQLRINMKRNEPPPRQIRLHLYLCKAPVPANSEGRQKSSRSVPAHFYITVVDEKGKTLRIPSRGYHSGAFKENHGWGYDRFMTMESLKGNLSHLIQPNGSLIIKCHVLSQYQVLHRDCHIGQIRFCDTDDKIGKPEDLLSESFLSLLQNPILSDLEILVGSKIFPVHKAVLFARCQLFKEFFTAPQPAPLHRIQITEYDEDIVKVLLEYLYGGEPLSIDVITSKASDVFRMAEDYKLPCLLTKCDEILANNLKVHTALDIMVAAEKHNREELVGKCIYFINWSKAAIIETESFKKVSNENPHIFKHLYFGQYIPNTT